MWLGRALFLKGEGRRGQALQEYREGIRVLQESKADEGSASMALFRWYLGTALLDAGEVGWKINRYSGWVRVPAEVDSIRSSKLINHEEMGWRDKRSWMWVSVGLTRFIPRKVVRERKL